MIISFLVSRGKGKALLCQIVSVMKKIYSFFVILSKNIIFAFVYH